MMKQYLTLKKRQAKESLTQEIFRSIERGKVVREYTCSLLGKAQLSFQEIVNVYRKTRDDEGDSYLWMLLANKKFVSRCIEKQCITDEDLRWLWTRIQKSFELRNFCFNRVLLLEYFSRNLIDAKSLIDKFKKCDNFDYFLEHESLSRWLKRRNFVDQHHIQYAFNKISYHTELFSLCRNTLLIKELFENFDNTSYIEKFNTLLKKSKELKYFHSNVSDIFECAARSWELKPVYFEFQNKKHSAKLIELFKIYKFLHHSSFDAQQKQYLLKLVQKNQKAKTLLLSVIENNLESTYTNFDVLCQILVKDDRKKKLKLNF